MLVAMNPFKRKNKLAQVNNLFVDLWYQKI